MNLHQIVRGAISAVNPDVTGSVLVSAGYMTSPDGTRVPAYLTPVTMQMQVQPLSAADLKQIDSLNIQGVDRAIYVSGAVRGVERASGKGGDLIRVLGAWWLAVVVLEPWDGAGWSKVGVAQQVTGPPA